jgi:hypothetical protein
MSKKSSAIPERIKGQLRGTSRLRITLSDIRSTISPERYPALMAWLPKLRHGSRGIFSGQFPTNVTRLKKDWPFEPILREREILWATELIKCHAVRLNSFVQKALEYERTLLGADYSLALDVLESIDEEFGVSLWSIENKIAVLQVAHGLERQKTFVNNIRSARVSNPVAVIAFFASERCESATNPLQFKQVMVERAEKWEVDQAYKDYLLFRITDEYEFSPETCASILRYEATSSVIDYYDTYVRLAQRATLTSRPPTALLSGLEALAGNIEDHRIDKILLLNGSGGSRRSALHAQKLTPFEHIARGEFQSALTTAESALEEDPLDITLRFVSARAHAELQAEKSGGPGLGGRIERLCSSLTIKKDSTEDEYLEALRLALAFRLMNFAGSFVRFIRDHCSSYPISNGQDVLKSFLDSPYLDPRDLAWLPKNILPHYAKILCDSYGSSPGLATEMLRAGIEPPADSTYTPTGDMALHIKIHRSLESKEHEEVLNLARGLDQSTSQHTRRTAARYIAHSLLEVKRLDEAIDFVVERALSDPSAVFVLPIATCAERLDKKTRRTLAPKLSTPIVLDLFARHISDRLDNIRAYAYEDFLIANHVERPSQLSEMLDHFQRHLLVYYLRKICVPRIMQVSSAFRGSQHLEQERLAVCSLLRQIDEQDVKEYELEIREITRNQLIQLGVRHVDQSRIFVDLAAIRRWAERNLKEGFARYRALLEAGVDTGVTAFTEALEDALEEGKVPKQILALPKNEANDLLYDLVSRVFLECMTNPEYGLDCYLSMRIRHGTLSGQLRGPLEEQKVITQREGGSQQYKPNEFWLQRIDTLNPAGQQELDALLSKFSRDYDTVIDNFASDFIQVHSTEKEGGLFNRSLPELFLGVIASELKADTTFEDFINICFDFFWRRVEIDLKAIRTKVDVEFKPTINALFASLESELDDKFGNSLAPDLHRAIRIAQTGAQNALNQVNEWFHLRKPESAPSLTLQEIIDIGLQCVKNIHPDFRPDIEQTIPTIPPFIEWIPLSDIFFILFENIQKHSGIVAPTIEILASQKEGQVRIMVKSEVNNRVDTSQAELRVAKIKQAISEGSYQRGVRSEGGTGLMKLRKIIGQNPKRPNHLDFGFNDQNQFFVELELPYREFTT